MKRFAKLAQFQTFNDPQLEGMLREATRFAASINYTAPYWLTLAGPSGNGKSHLVRAIWKQFMQQNRFDNSVKLHGNTGIWCDWRKFCNDIRCGQWDLAADLCDEWFVVLDDIATEHDPSGFIASKLDLIANARRQKWTLITVNLRLNEIAEKLDPRIASRMLRDNGVVYEINTTDYALRSMA